MQEQERLRSTVASSMQKKPKKEETKEGRDDENNGGAEEEEGDEEDAEEDAEKKQLDNLFIRSKTKVGKHPTLHLKLPFLISNGQIRWRRWEY